MRYTADVRYTFTSWQAAFPGHAVDLTALVFPPVHYDAGVDAALRLLDLGPRPRGDVVADIREDLREMLFAAEDMECAYAAVFYPEPHRTSEHVWLGFSVYDNAEEPLSPVEALADEVLDPARHEVVGERVKEVELPVGPAARLFQTTVTRDPELSAFHFRPRLTLCGAAPCAGTRFVIRAHATGAALVDVLDKQVMAWARAVSSHGFANGCLNGSNGSNSSITVSARVGSPRPAPAR